MSSASWRCPRGPGAHVLRRRRDDGGGSEAKTLNPRTPKDASGKVTWCIGKDTSGAFKTAVESFNEQNPKLEAKLLELPENADIQREQQIQRLRAESSECDVLGMDVIWTAEYAASGWLYDLTPAVEAHESEFIPSTVETVEYEGKKWAIPFNTNAGFLFYRTNEVPEAAVDLGRRSIKTPRKTTASSTRANDTRA